MDVEKIVPFEIEVESDENTLEDLNDTSFVDIDSLEEDGIEYLAGYIITYRKYLTMEICRTARKN